MIRPMVVGDPVAEVSLCIVGGAFRCVDDPVLVSMFCVEELSNLHGVNFKLARANLPYRLGCGTCFQSRSQDNS